MPSMPSNAYILETCRSSEQRPYRHRSAYGLL
jgi:hypothetical protein